MTDSRLVNGGAFLIVPTNVGAPATLTVMLLAPVFAGDLTQVSALSGTLLRRDGTSTTLAFSVVSATAQRITAQYTFQGGELTTTGAYYLALTAAVPGGNLPAETITVYVTSPYATSPKLETTAWLAATVAIPAAPAASATEWVFISTGSSPYLASPVTPWIAVDASGGSVTVDIWTPANPGQFVVVADYKAMAAVNPIRVVASGTNSGTNTPWLLWDPSNPGSYTGSATINSPSGAPQRWRPSFTKGLWLPW